jgi:hypothetical protein
MQDVKIVLVYCSLVLYQRKKCFIKVSLEYLDNKIILIEESYHKIVHFVYEL